MAHDNPTQYTVLARRFRPQAFAEVVGQEHVGQAIQNAIRTNRVAHAYLFTGARGVGKTSTARIFAKALNCPNAVDGIPCNQCDVCQSIAAGSDVDVLEIDGASNRGIDDVRQLRANVSIRSMRSPYKVYIIDEVHMLTKEAFNALLKTLEEPPPNVKFVFCTTEPNKVPDTILSRCQRFDFGTIAQESIAARLKEIADAEGKQVDAEAIELVARRAAGSMRDSQSLFDQLLAFGGERITVQDVHQLLGTAPDDRLLDLVEAFISQQPAAALAQIEAALHEGVQIGSFSDQLLACLRDLLVIAAGAGEAGLSALNESSRSRLEEQARRWGLQTISSAMQILAETKAKMQRVNYGRALLELAIVRMATLEQLDQIAALLQQGTAPASSGAPGAAPAAKVGSADLKKNLSAVLKSPAANSARPVSSANVAVATLPSTAVSEKGDAPDSLPASRVELSSATLPQFWEQMLAAAPETLAGHLKNASQTAISGPNRLEILFPRSYLFSKSYCERTEPLKKLISVAGQLAGQPVEFRFAVDETAAVVARPAPASAPPAVQRRRTSTVDGDPFVQQALAIFGGQVVEVRTIPQAGVVEAAAEGAVEEADDASE